MLGNGLKKKQDGKWPKIDLKNKNQTRRSRNLNELLKELKPVGNKLKRVKPQKKTDFYFHISRNIDTFGV